MTEVKAPTIPWVNKDREQAPARQPKRARTQTSDEENHLAATTTTTTTTPNRTSTTMTLAAVPRAPSTSGQQQLEPIPFDQVPWEAVITDNSTAFYAEQFKCIKVSVTLPNGEPLFVGFRTRLMFNPTVAYEGSNQKPEIHSSAPRDSPQYIGSVRFNDRVQILYKEQHKKWGKEDKVPRSDLRLQPIPKPGGPKEKDAKEEARRCREFKETFVAPPGTTYWEPKISAKWPWAQGLGGKKISTTGKYGCTVVDEYGAEQKDIMAFFTDSKGKGQGQGWDVVMVWQPYIWASNTTFKYGGSYNLKFMRVINRAASATSFNTSSFAPISSSSSSSSSSSTSSSSASCSDFG